MSLEIQDAFEPYYCGRHSAPAERSVERLPEGPAARRPAKARLSERPAWDLLEKPMPRPS
jgi:hypothetical protein